MRFGSIRSSGECNADNSEQRERAILHDRAEMLYSGAFLALAVSFATALLFVRIHLSLDVKDGQWLWLGVISVVLVARALLAWLFHRRRQIQQ
jgi:cytochrome bd-type quinol oxidase subunit 2